MENVIRLGDFIVNGIPVACENDLCSCPVKGHDGCRIAPNRRPHVIGGVHVAFEGDQTTCGAKLTSSLKTFHTDLVS
jgi:uncharacterized Zn-binding protein involved in type VI secretion